MENFTAYSKYYDLLYNDKPYGMESDYVAQILRKHNPDIKNILELGCGSGSHANHLCQQGFLVTGIEKSCLMVEEAKKKCIQNFSPIVGDISNFSLGRKFDATISLFHVISYLTTNIDLINCFSIVNDHLFDDGLFFFDVWYTPAVYVQRPEVRIKKLESDTISVWRVAEPDVHYASNVVDVNFDVNIYIKSTGVFENIVEKHPMRHFSIPEVELLAMHTGFEVLTCQEFLTGNLPSEKTWGVCFLLRKISDLRDFSNIVLR